MVSVIRPLALVSLIACGSSGSGSGLGTESSGGDAGSAHFTIDAGSVGTFTCPTAPEAVLLQGTLMVTCSQGSSGTGIMTFATLHVTGWHGSGMYTVQGTSDAAAGTFQVTIGNTLVLTSPASGPDPATSCTATIDGPANLAMGDEVSGHVHCDNLTASSVSGGGNPGSMLVSADGDFVALEAL
jgi:hypothetical protein